MMSVDVLTAAVVVPAVASVAWSTVVPIAIALRRGGRQDSPSADGPALSVSRFTIPVSIVVPIDAESASACRVIANLLALSYPELEVIVVADGLPPQDVRALATTWCLKPSEFFYRRVLDTCDVRRIFRGRDDRLIIVEKAAGGHADAVNCGVNFARFRYIAVVKPEVNCEPDALLRSMAPALRDPGHVLAVVTHVERRLQVRLKPDPTYGMTSGSAGGRATRLFVAIALTPDVSRTPRTAPIRPRTVRGVRLQPDLACCQCSNRSTRFVRSWKAAYAHWNSAAVRVRMKRSSSGGVMRFRQREG
jgi:hypothetical protein